jgi:hypothetical protein
MPEICKHMCAWTHIYVYSNGDLTLAVLVKLALCNQAILAIRMGIKLFHHL